MHNAAIKRKPVKRPKNLNLMTIRFPVNAMVSIMHRMSGVALFLVLPFLVGAMQYSLQNEQQYEQLAAWLTAPVFKLLFIALAWAFFHHFYAGFRHLAMDAHKMTSLPQARTTSRVVMGCTLISVMIFSYWVW